MYEFCTFIFFVVVIALLAVTVGALWTVGIVLFLLILGNN